VRDQPTVWGMVGPSPTRALAAGRDESRPYRSSPATDTQSGPLMRHSLAHPFESPGSHGSSGRRAETVGGLIMTHVLAAAGRRVRGSSGEVNQW